MSDSTRTTITRRAARRTALAALAGIAALTITATACTPAQAGAAALIGDRRISSDQVSEAVAGIKAGNPQLANGQGLERTVVYFLVIAPYVLSAAESNGVGVSVDEAKALLPDAANPDPNAVRVLRTFIALQKMQQAGKTDALNQVQKDVIAAKPELNPRYGSFDVQQMAVVDAPPNWIVPNTEPTATSTDAP